MEDELEVKLKRNLAKRFRSMRRKRIRDLEAKTRKQNAIRNRMVRKGFVA